jgi:hypothetical protein
LVVVGAYMLYRISLRDEGIIAFSAKGFIFRNRRVLGLSVDEGLGL